MCALTGNYFKSLFFLVSPSPSPVCLFVGPSNCQFLYVHSICSIRLYVSSSFCPFLNLSVHLLPFFGKNFPEHQISKCKAAPFSPILIFSICHKKKHFQPCHLENFSRMLKYSLTYHVGLDLDKSKRCILILLSGWFV